MSSLPKNKFVDQIDRNDYGSSLKKLNNVLGQKSLSKKDRLKVQESKAECLQGMDEFEEAESLYKDIIAQNENYYRAYYGLNLIYNTLSINNIGSGDKKYTDKIINLWKDLESISPKQVSYSSLADAYSYKGAYDKAIKCYKRALRNEKQLFWKSDISADIGSVYFRLGKYKESLKAYENAVNFSRKEWGNIRSCGDYFAVMREIYRRINRETEEEILEMENAYKRAEKLRNNYNKKRENMPSSKKSDSVKKIEEIGKSLKEGIKKERNLKKKFASFIKEEIQSSESYSIDNINDIERLVDIATNEMYPNDEHELAVEEKFSYKLELILLITEQKV